MKKRLLSLWIAVLTGGVLLSACGSSAGSKNSGQQGDATADGSGHAGQAGKTGGPDNNADAKQEDVPDNDTGEKKADVPDNDTGEKKADVPDNDTGTKKAGEPDTRQDLEPAEIQVFIAASLHMVMEELAEKFCEIHPQVEVTYNADSSGTLMTQIQEGYACDIFFSAAQKQMDQLEADGLIREGTRANVVNNQVVVISRKGSGTKVTGLSDMHKAESIALAGGSVPVGKYTRQALVNLNILQQEGEPADITTKQVSDALGGVEISEQDNVSKVLSAVLEGSCEVGTTYYSDTYGYEKELDILETVGYDLTGNVVYPIALVVNGEAADAQEKAAEAFLEYVLSEEAKEVFQAYYFDTDIKENSQ